MSETCYGKPELWYIGVKLYNVGVKFGPSSLKTNCLISLIEIPLKMMKNAFYFILKALSVLKIFKFFFTTFWSCRKNGLVRKIRSISKFLTS